MRTDEPDTSVTDERTVIDLRGVGSLLTLGHYRYVAAHRPLPTQQHSRLLVLVLPLRGDVEFVLDGVRMPAGPGDVMLLRPGVAYCTGVGRQARGELLWLVLDAARDRRRPAHPLEAALDQAVQQLRSSTEEVWRVPDAVVDTLARALGTVSVSEAHTRAWRYALCAAAVLDLVAGMDSSQGAREGIHPALRRSLCYLDDHLHEPVTAAQLVEASGLSATHFFNLFAATFGTSPKDFVLRTKIEKSQRLLADASVSVTDIAHSLGFSSGQHFASAFRRYVGVSPSAYRAEARREDLDLPQRRASGGPRATITRRMH